MRPARRPHALLFLCAVCLVAATGAPAQERGPLPSINFAAPPSAMEQAPRLPQGPLQLFGRTEGAAHFIALSDISRRESLVEATVLTIAEPAPPRTGTPAPLVVSRQAIDCARRTFATYHAWYAEDGRLLDAERAFEPRPLQAGTVSALLAARVCDGAAPGETVDGHAAALAVGRRLLGVAP